MIKRQAVEQYLKEKRDNLNWIKRLNDNQLNQELVSIGFEENRLDGLMLHQKAAVFIGIGYPTLCLWCQMGVGKTRITLELLNYFYVNGILTGKTIICSPTDEVVQSWQNEIEKWGIKIPYVTLLGSSVDKWAEMRIDSGLVLGTYVGMAYMVSALQPAKKGSKNQLAISREKITPFMKGVQGLVLDESTKVSSWQSLSFKVCNHISQQCKVRYALAGRPFGRDPIQLWAQFYLVDRGETLSPTLGFYREVFFNKKKLFWHPNAIEFKFDPKMKKDLTRITAHRSITYTIEECVTLPELVRIQRYVSFPPETLEYYNRLVTRVIDAEGDLALVKSTFLQMRQLSSGFLGLKDDETGERAEITFDKNPKLELLMEIVDELPEGKKLVVFYDYTWTGLRVSEELKKRKVKHGVLRGGTKDWPAMEKRFNEDDDYQVLVINSRKGSMGLNLQRASYVCFIETPTSSIDRDQAEKRIHRKGQENTCFIIDLIMVDGIDAKLMAYQNEARELFKALVTDPASVLSLKKAS